MTKILESDRFECWAEEITASSAHPSLQMTKLGRYCSTVGRAVTTDAIRPGFESSQGQKKRIYVQQNF